MSVNLNTVSPLQLLFLPQVSQDRQQTQQASQSSIRACHQITRPLFSMYRIGTACGRSVPFVRPTTAIEEHVLVRQQMHDPTRGDVARTRRSDKERSSCKAFFVSCPQVRCHENLNMSNKMCVCVDRDGVQTVLPVCSQQTRLQFCGCLKTEPKLLSGNRRVHTPVCDERVP